MSASLVDALIAARDAEKNVAAVLKAEYPVGSKVRWMRGFRIHHGEVIHVGCRNDRIQVRDEAIGNTLWVNAFDVAAAWKATA